MDISLSINEESSDKDVDFEEDDDFEASRPLRPYGSVANEKEASIYYSFYESIVKYWVVIVPMIVLLKIILASMFVFLIVQTARDNARTYVDVKTELFSLPSIGLRERIHFTTLQARESGSLQTRKISSRVFSLNGLKFILCKPVEDESYSAPAKDSIGADALDINNIHDSLVIHRFDEIDGPMKLPYTLVLNKYNTIPDHALLLSDEFSSQMSPITVNELLLLYWSMRATDGIGWYNSNTVAGASQWHKHLQLLPMDEFWSLHTDDSEYPTLLHDLTLPHIEAGRWSPYPTPAMQSTFKPTIRIIPEFDFVHGLVVLDRKAGEAAQTKYELIEYAKYLHYVYEQLLISVGIGIEELARCTRNTEIGGAYNLVVAEDFMFIVKRSQLRHYSGVNSMGYLGLVLATNKEQEDAYRSEGILPTLQAVSAKK